MIPIYGDVQIRLPDLVKQTTHYDPSKWTCTSEQAEVRAAPIIVNRVETIRSEHLQFVLDLTRHKNEVRDKWIQVQIRS